MQLDFKRRAKMLVFVLFKLLIKYVVFRSRWGVPHSVNLPSCQQCPFTVECSSFSGESSSPDEITWNIIHRVSYESALSYEKSFNKKMTHRVWIRGEPVFVSNSIFKTSENNRMLNYMYWLVILEKEWTGELEVGREGGTHADGHADTREKILYTFLLQATPEELSSIYWFDLILSALSLSPRPTPLSLALLCDFMFEFHGGEKWHLKYENRPDGRQANNQVEIKEIR